MRIRKGERCVPLAATDRTCLLMKGFVREDANATLRDGAAERNQALAVTAAAVASHGDDVQAVTGSGAPMWVGTERLEDDGARSRLSDDGRSRKRPPICEGVISISTIIQAGIKAAKRNSTSSPASGESAVTSVASFDTKAPTDCSPSIAEKTTAEPNVLLDSLKKVCSASASTGLTAKEAVAQILEQGLPGLIEGGERLIVQVAKLFRGSPAFAEREERGRYYMQETFQELMGWDVVPKGEANMRQCDSKAAPRSGSKNATDGAPKLQSAKEEATVCGAVGFTAAFAAIIRTSARGRWVLASRGNEKATPEIKTSVLEDGETKLRCNRDDGKGWRCMRFAEPGYSLCKYHREQIRKAENRRRKSRSRSKKRRTSPMAAVSSPVSAAVQSEIKPVEGDVKPASVNEAGELAVGADNSTESDNEVGDRRSRRVVKAKSLKSL